MKCRTFVRNEVGTDTQSHRQENLWDHSHLLNLIKIAFFCPFFNVWFPFEIYLTSLILLLNIRWNVVFFRRSTEMPDRTKCIPYIVLDDFCYRLTLLGGSVQIQLLISLEIKTWTNLVIIDSSLLLSRRHLVLSSLLLWRGHPPSSSSLGTCRHFARSDWMGSSGGDQSGRII